MPYDYYSLPFCKPDKVENAVENLGEVLHGSVIQNSPYKIEMGKPDLKVLCKHDLTFKESKLLTQRIQQDYRVHLIMDNLPAATKVRSSHSMIRELPDGKTITMYDRGYPLGFVGSKERPGSKAGEAYIYNHLRFVIKFHKEDSKDAVEPLSVKHQYKGTFKTDMDSLALLTVPVGPDLPPQSVVSKTEIVYTYDVKWEHSDTKWASRWDLYLYMGDDQIHWCASVAWFGVVAIEFSIINSLAIVLLLTGIVAMIMMRTLRRDFNRRENALSQHSHLPIYCRRDNTSADVVMMCSLEPGHELAGSIIDKEDLQEESGWKLVHADVFRHSPHAASLLRPPLLLPRHWDAAARHNEEGLTLCAACVQCAMLGFLSPANRGGLLTATLLLFVLMGVPAGYFSSNTYKSLKGTEWKKMTVLTATLYPAFIFLTFFFLNFFVPEQAWYMGGVFNVLMGGILPFGAIFIELFFIMTSMWLQRFYYVFGFLML
ncbi:MAG: hypothetical protein SGPRY_012682, partial [Prymnesium sp.]